VARSPQGKTKVAQLRKVLGIPAQEFASVIGRTVDTVRSLEIGRLALSRDLAERISFEFGVNLNWLLNEAYKGPPVGEDRRELTAEQMLKRMAAKRAEFAQELDRMHKTIPDEMANALRDILKDAAGYAAFHLALYHTGKLFAKLQNECLPPEKRRIEVDDIIRWVTLRRPKRRKKSSESKKPRP
jgi:transcriptional regulator with XRE-family HTH domain